jgi:recombination protein RecA
MATGKTTLCIHIAKGFQEEGFRVMYIDAEYSFDRVYAEAIGLDMDKLDFVQPESLEDGLEVMREACRESTHELIIFDSVAAARLRPETEGDVGDANMGRKGFIMSQAVRMLVPDAAQSFTTLLFVNQVRESLKNWGSATYRPAGKALDFASVQMVELKSPASKDAVRKEVIMKCTKNKTYPPLGERKMTLEYGKGFVS